MQGTTTVQAAASFRNPYEQFTWMDTEWDIAKFWKDYDEGRVRPEETTFDAEFLEGYATQVLLVDKNAGPDAPRRVSFLMAVDVAHAKSLPEAALDEPLVVLRTKKGKGMLTLNPSEGPCYVLGDGNHRVARAYLDGRASMKVLVLSAAQSRRYVVN